MIRSRAAARAPRKTAARGGNPCARNSCFSLRTARSSPGCRRSIRTGSHRCRTGSIRSPAAAPRPVRSRAVEPVIDHPARTNSRSPRAVSASNPPDTNGPPRAVRSRNNPRDRRLDADARRDRGTEHRAAPFHRLRDGSGSARRNTRRRASRVRVRHEASPKFATGSCMGQSASQSDTLLGSSLADRISGSRAARRKSPNAISVRNAAARKGAPGK